MQQLDKLVLPDGEKTKRTSTNSQAWFSDYKKHADTGWFNFLKRQMKLKWNFTWFECENWLFKVWVGVKFIGKWNVA